MSNVTKESAPAHEHSPAGQEREAKFTVDHEKFAHVLATLQTANPIAAQKKLTSVYFDTAEFALRRAGIVLRVRHDAHAGSETVKRILGVKFRAEGNVGAFSRVEEEVEINADVPDVGLFRNEIGQRLKEIIADQELSVQFSTNVERCTFVISETGLDVEIALDQGTANSPQQSLPIREIELEQKSGSPAAFYQYASHFCLCHGLTLDFVNKSDKGFKMIGANIGSNTSSAQPKLKKSMPARLAAAAIINTTCHHFALQWAGCRNGNDADAIHQARVELRRLRSAFSIFKSVLPQPYAEKLDGCSKDIANGFALARKLDVFRTQFTLMHAENVLGPEQVSAFCNTLEAARTTAYENAIAVLNAPQTSAFLLDVQCLAEKLVAEQGSETQIGVMAKLTLGQLAAKAMKRGRKIQSRAPPELHRLRITLKKLRYSSEFFADVLNSQKHWIKRAKTIKQLQEILGSLNDVAETRQLLDSVLGVDAARHAGIVGYILGWQTRDGAEKRRELVEPWHGFKSEM